MFVYLGEEVVVDVRQLVAILDVRRLRRDAASARVAERAVRGHPGEPVPRAVIVTTRGVFPVAIGPEAVAKRIQKMARSRLRKTARR